MVFRFYFFFFDSFFRFSIFWFLSTGSTEYYFVFWFFDFFSICFFDCSIRLFDSIRFFGSSIQQQARVSTAVFILKASAAVFVDISSMDDAGNEQLLRLLLLHRLQKKRRERSQRCCWVRPILLRRDQVGESHTTLVQEMRNADPVAHQRYFRMTAADFDELLFLVSLTIHNKHAKSDITRRASGCPCRLLPRK